MKFPKPITASKEKQKTTENLFAKIIEQTADLSRKDIKKWRLALQAYMGSPESSTLAPLQQIYADLLMDGHVSSQILLRKSSILNTAYVALVNDEIDEVWTKYFNQSEWVYNLTDTILDTIFTGTVVVEFTQIVDLFVDFEELPKTHIHPKYKKLFIDANDPSKFILYESPQFANRLVQIGKDNHIGILNNIVPQLIWSRYAEQSWSEFCERFGLPMITATSNKNNAAEISQLEKKLSTIGEGLTAVLPTGTTIEIQQPNNSDAYLVFEKRINKCEDKISKQILAGTMLTDSGSSRSQSEVHERNLDEKISLMDMRYNEFTWNNKIIPLLRQRGFPLPENFYLQLDISEKVDYTQLIDFILSLLQTYSIPIEWLEKTFGIPLQEKATNSEQRTTNNGKQTTSSERQKANDEQKPRALSFEALKDFLFTLVDEYKVPPSVIESHLEIPIPFREEKAKQSEHNTCPCCGGIRSMPSNLEDKFFSENKILQTLHERYQILVERLFHKKSHSKEQHRITELYQALFSEGLDRHFDYGSLAIDSPDAICRQAMESNLFQFSAAKTSEITEALNRTLYEGEKRRTWSEFKARAEEIGIEYNQNHLKVEYQHAVAVGQSSSAWFQLWREREDIPYMEYQTIGDDKVREEHQTLNRKIFRIDDPEAQKLFPPNGWHCRCEMLAYTGKASEILQGKEAISILKSSQSGKQDFLVNFAVERVVFPM